MIFVTGDTHADLDIYKLTLGGFPKQKELTKNDYVIILGDFGLVWDESKREKYWLQWLDKKPWTTLFVDGNHDNHPLIWEHPLVPMFGDEVRQISETVFYLQRGHVYNIDGNSFLALGGAESIDKDVRVEGVSWWSTESIRYEDYYKALDAVSKTRGVDCILTHAAPLSVESMLGQYISPTQSSRYLEDLRHRIPHFKKWFFGHYHIDNTIILREEIMGCKNQSFFRALYKDILCI